MNPTAQNPLAALKDIHLPPTPNWWPPAPGWWLVTLLLLAAISFVLIKWRQRQLRLRPIKLALTELAQLDLKSDNPEQQHQILQELSALIRRFCIVFFPQAPVAGLCGEAWLNFLIQETPAKNQSKDQNELTRKKLRPLLEETYAPTCNTDLVALGQLIEQWFSGQKGKPKGRS
ncbi:MAG: DUF4381 domain-containing protein [Pseudomonadota bacterium]|nr:DUF4381 domain-containing protein [Pseudomonadota bacterium]